MEEVSAVRPSHPRPNRTDIFEKCWNFNRARALKEAGLYLYFEVFGSRLSYRACGSISTGTEMALARRLAFIHRELTDLIAEHAGAYV